MQDIRGNDIIKWVTVVLDWLLACCLLIVFDEILPQYSTSSAMNGSKSELMVLLMSIIIATFIFPTVIHRRKMKVGWIVRRNAFLVITTMVIFVFTCRMMSTSGNYIVFGVVYGLVLWIAIMTLRFFERAIINHFRSEGKNSRTIIFIGNDPANLNVYKELMSDPATGYRVLGYYSDSVIDGAPASLPKMGSRDDFRKFMEEYPNGGIAVEEIYCSLSHSQAVELRQIMEFCDKNVIRFYYVPRIFSNIQLSLRPEKFGDTVIFTNHHEPLMFLGNRVMKRLFDIAFSSMVLVMLSPLFPILALIIKMQSKGPVFFKQLRTGLNGESFMCYKFRSMHVNADADKIQATKHDPRKFPFGNFMRKTNLDELPQFLNVLKGDMSIVGPRPHMIFHTEKYSALIDKYMVRHFSKPGITGYAQVTGFRGETEELWQMEGRIQKDIWYIENWSMWLDIKIIFMTALSIIRPDKAAY
jgi:putative colanic acid biosynthesis UDP-glucose lipid carrier transferase